jgi:uncharacterized cupin superfamily protein
VNPVAEARLETLESGLAPATGGWFVVNARDAAWETGPFGGACFFESEAVPFVDLGINLRVLSPASRWLYHSESMQEDFLVLAGECLLLVEEEERPLRAWDFVHCPAGTAHAFVASSDNACVVLMVGARSADDTFCYPLSELALRHGVGVERETSSPVKANAGLPSWEHARPAGWDALPWA